MNSCIIKNENELDGLVQKVAALCTEQYSIALHGDLGAGKTTFVKHLGKLWNIDDVKSPSFGIVDVHRGIKTLIHIDAYRLKNGTLNAFDLDDLCTPPYCLIVEWPEYLSHPFRFDLHLFFALLPDGSRKITWTQGNLA